MNAALAWMLVIGVPLAMLAVGYFAGYWSGRFKELMIWKRVVGDLQKTADEQQQRFEDACAIADGYRSLLAEARKP